MQTMSVTSLSPVIEKTKITMIRGQFRSRIGPDAVQN